MDNNLTPKMIKRIGDADTFRNVLLAMNNVVKVETSDQKVEFLDFIYKNNPFIIKDEEQLERCIRLLRRNLLMDFELIFNIVDGKVKCVSMYRFQKPLEWRLKCAMLHKYKEREQFGYSDIDVNTWLPEGYNF